MSKHLLAQNKTYGHQSLVNLVNQKGHEKPLKEAYERYVTEVSYMYCFTRIWDSQQFALLSAEPL